MNTVIFSATTSARQLASEINAANYCLHALGMYKLFRMQIFSLLFFLSQKLHFNHTDIISLGRIFSIASATFARRTNREQGDDTVAVQKDH